LRIAHQELIHGVRAVRARLQRHIAKPVEAAELIAMVASIFTASRRGGTSILT
jgi:hypothetical protein